VDAPEESAKLKEDLRLGFPLLSDSEERVIERYGLVHRKGHLGTSDIARPANLLLDGQGIIRWAMFTENWRVRARPEALLEAAKRLSRP
jgi:peroxiredoxin